MTGKSTNATRCPFLMGELGGKQFDGITEHGGVKLDFNCPLCYNQFNHLGSTCVKNHCLDEEHTGCPHYSLRAFELSLKIPIHCPLQEDTFKESGELACSKKCSHTGKVCDRYYIDVTSEDPFDDYRTCRVFGKWFYTDKKGEHEEMVINRAHVEKCPICCGSGKLEHPTNDDYPPITCNGCHGKGWVTTEDGLDSIKNCAWE